MYVMSPLSCLEPRPFWQHWKTVPCLFCCWSWMACAGPWEQDHCPGPSAVEWTLCCRCRVDVHQTGHLESQQAWKGHCFQLHHQLPPSPSCHGPTGTHQEELLLQVGPDLVLSLLPSPVPQLLAGCWHPHRDSETQHRGHCCSSLQ